MEIVKEHRQLLLLAHLEHAQMHQQPQILMLLVLLFKQVVLQQELVVLTPWDYAVLIQELIRLAHNI